MSSVEGATQFWIFWQWFVYIKDIISMDYINSLLWNFYLKIMYNSYKGGPFIMILLPTHFY